MRRSAVGIKGAIVLALLAVAVLLGGCDSDVGTDAPSNTGTDSPSDSGTDAPSDTGIDPSLDEGRIEGRYEGPLTLIRSNVEGNHTRFIVWTFAPLCDEGACAIELRSQTGGFRMQLAPTGKHYAGQVRRPGFYICDEQGYPATQNMRLTVEESALVDGRWMATRLSGVMASRNASSSPCGDAFERYGISLKAQSDGD